ncbi:CSLREA domain-containing protein, partial [bacterium]|nr:CSLREA domain-containing protein [bacterium]
MNSINNLLKASLMLLCMLIGAGQLLADYDSEGVDLVGRSPYGHCLTTAPFGEYACIGNGAVVELVDLATMEPVYEFVTEHLITSIHISGSYAFVSNWGDSLIVLDISDPEVLTKVATLEVPGVIASMSMSGDHLYAGYYNELQIIDISNPLSPQSIGFFQPEGEPDFNYSCVRDDIAYAATNYGLYIIDISEPTNPDQLGFIGSDFGSTSVSVVDSLAYVSEAGQIRIVNISDPANPYEAGTYASNRATFIQIHDGLAYVANWYSGLMILDLSDPLIPEEYASVESIWAIYFSFSGDSLYLASRADGFNVIDISDPSSPLITGSCTTGMQTWDIYQSGDYLYVSDRHAWFNIYNISDPAAPQLYHSLEIYSTRAVHGSGDFVYTISQGNLEIIDMSDPDIPSVTTWMEGSLSTVFAVGNFVYLGSTGSFQVLDLSDPLSPVLLGTLEGLEGSSNLGIFVNDMFAFLTNNEAGVHIINIADPTNPQLVSTYTDFDEATNIYVSGKYAYVVERSTGVWILDISDPEMVQGIHHVDLGPTVDVSGSGRYIYALTDYYGLQVIDAGNPYDPVEIGFHETSGATKALYSVMGNIYSCDSNAGFYIFQTELKQAVFTVNSTGDAQDAFPGDGICVDGSGDCTLRAAIQEANAHPGYDKIEFAIPGLGVHTIQPSFQLPEITEPLFMDATSQQGYSGTPLIELDGIDIGPHDGLVFSGGHSKLVGMAITQCGLEVAGEVGWGVKIQGGAGTVIQACFIGTDVTGTEMFGNTIGLYVENSRYNLIGGLQESERNLISGNLWTGIDISAPSEGDKNSILGNYIGTDITGTIALGNGAGINLFTGGNFVGGPAPGAGNVISGNVIWGLMLTLDGPEGDPNLVRGNMIGTCACGTAAVANGEDGIIVESQFNVIGGTEPGEGNLISGNWGNGVVLVSNNFVRGNLIGLNKYGTSAIGNLNAGVMINGSENLVGGTDPGDRNVISGNLEGVTIAGGGTAINNTVQGNYIGTDLSGSNEVGNSTGILLLEPNNFIGGTEPGAGNLISGNEWAGVNIGYYEFPNCANGNTVQGNMIGTDISGTLPIPNYGGVYIEESGSNIIGGVEPGAGNLISGNAISGVEINGAYATANNISGNLIGTDVSGNLAIPNNLGIVIEASGSNNIGGSQDGAGNLISGNAQSGIELRGTLASENIISGNLIGTNVTAELPLPNLSGISFRMGSTQNLVGGVGPGAGNVISGNSRFGLKIYNGSNNNIVQGNAIGTNFTGDLDLGNLRDGIRIYDNSTDNLIGGVDDGAANIVAFNGQSGVLMYYSGSMNGNQVMGNSIYMNQDLGIDLGGVTGSNGLTPNDPGDADEGPNRLQNFPESLNVGVDDSEDLIIQYLVDSEIENSEYPLYVEFFLSDVEGEGAMFLASNEYSEADHTAGLKTVSFGPAVDYGLSMGDHIVATATDAGGNTSEFSEMSELGVYVSTDELIAIPETYVLEQNYPN